MSVILKKKTNADIDTPIIDKVHIFLDSADSKLKYKDDAGATSTIASELVVDTKISSALIADKTQFTPTTETHLNCTAVGVSDNSPFGRGVYSNVYTATKDSIFEIEANITLTGNGPFNACTTSIYMSPDNINWYLVPMYNIGVGGYAGVNKQIIYVVIAKGNYYKGYSYGSYGGCSATLTLKKIKDF